VNWFGVSESAKKKRRTQLDVSEKRDIVVHKSKNFKQSQDQIASYFSKLWSNSVGRSTVMDIWTKWRKNDQTLQSSATTLCVSDLGNMRTQVDAFSLVLQC
jgi:hypothetical protein